MNSLRPVRLLFFVSSAYDGLLGFAFLFAAPTLFALTDITPPNHWGYVHFAAGTLVIFALIFLQIALKPVENLDLVIYGVLLKACYIGTVAWHALTGSIPVLWILFAVADLVFLALFLWARWRLHAVATAQSNWTE